MENNENEQKNWIEKIQSIDEDRKRRWMVLIAIIIMIVVIFIWLRYFNILVSMNAPEPSPVPQNGGFSFWQTAKGGATMIYQSIISGIKNLFAAFGSSKSYEIKPN